MGNTLYHTLVDPDRLCHYGTQVQDKLISESPLSNINEDGEFSMELSVEVFFWGNTHTHEL